MCILQSMQKKYYKFSLHVRFFICLHYFCITHTLLIINEREKIFRTGVYNFHPKKSLSAHAKLAQFSPCVFLLQPYILNYNKILLKKGSPIVALQIIVWHAFPKQKSHLHKELHFSLKRHLRRAIKSFPENIPSISPWFNFFLGNF